MSNADKPTLVQQITQRVQNNRLLAGLIVLGIAVIALANFTRAFQQLASVVPWTHQTTSSPTPTPVDWKIDSGWVLIGDYHASRRLFVRKCFELTHSNYPDAADIPRQGDLLRLTTERSLVVLDYATDNMKRLREPPWHGGRLKQVDYTPYKLPKGAIVEVREVSMPEYPNDAAVVWARVAKPSQ